MKICHISQMVTFTEPGKSDRSSQGQMQNQGSHFEIFNHIEEDIQNQPIDLVQERLAAISPLTPGIAIQVTATEKGKESGTKKKNHVRPKTSRQEIMWVSPVLRPSG